MQVFATSYSTPENTAAIIYSLFIVALTRRSVRVGLISIVIVGMAG